MMTFRPSARAAPLLFGLFLLFFPPSLVLLIFFLRHDSLFYCGGGFVVVVVVLWVGWDRSSNGRPQEGRKKRTTTKHWNLGEDGPFSEWSSLSSLGYTRLVSSALIPIRLDASLFSALLLISRIPSHFFTPFFFLRATEKLVFRPFTFGCNFTAAFNASFFIYFLSMFVFPSRHTHTHTVCVL